MLISYFGTHVIKMWAWTCVCLSVCTNAVKNKAKFVL